MKKYPIQSDVPIPTHRKNGGLKQQYPFPDMKIGDSFFVAGEDAKRICKNIGTAAYCWARDNKVPWKFCVRTTTDPKGARCWRLEDKSVGDPELQTQTSPFRHDRMAFETKPGEWVVGVYGPTGIIADAYGDNAPEALRNADLVTRACNAVLVVKT